MGELSFCQLFLSFNNAITGHSLLQVFQSHGQDLRDGESLQDFRCEGKRTEAYVLALHQGYVRNELIYILIKDDLN